MYLLHLQLIIPEYTLFLHFSQMTNLSSKKLSYLGLTQARLNARCSPVVFVFAVM